MILYYIDKRTFGGVRFIDVWGISRKELEKLPGISLVIGETVWNSLTVVADIFKAKDVVSEIVSRYGATELDEGVQK